MELAPLLTILVVVQNIAVEQAHAINTLPCMFFCAGSDSKSATTQSDSALGGRIALAQKTFPQSSFADSTPHSFQPAQEFRSNANSFVPQIINADSLRTNSAHDSGTAQFDNGPPATAIAPLTTGIDIQKLFAELQSREVQQLQQPYDNGPQKKERIDEDVVMLPPIVENAPGAVTFVDHRYPDENKNQVINTNKEIHAYTVQKKRINVHNTVVHRHHKLVNVNTDYITNIRRVAHPHKLTETFVETEMRHVPFIYVKHTRTDTVRDETKPIELDTQEVRQSSTELPLVYEKAVIKQLNYDRTQVPRQPEQQQPQQPQVQTVSIRGGNSNSPMPFTLLMPQMAS